MKKEQIERFNPYFNGYSTLTFMSKTIIQRSGVFQSLF